MLIGYIYMHSNKLQLIESNFDWGGIRGTVVACSTTGRQFERSILRQGQDSTQFISFAKVIPGPIYPYSVESWRHSFHFIYNWLMNVFLKSKSMNRIMATYSFDVKWTPSISLTRTKEWKWKKHMSQLILPVRLRAVMHLVKHLLLQITNIYIVSYLMLTVIIDINLPR